MPADDYMGPENGLPVAQKRVRTGRGSGDEDYASGSGRRRVEDADDAPIVDLVPSGSRPVGAERWRESVRDEDLDRLGPVAIKVSSEGAFGFFIMFFTREDLGSPCPWGSPSPASHRIASSDLASASPAFIERDQ